VLFNAENKALDKNLHQFKKYGSQTILAEFVREKLKTTLTEHFP